MSETRRKTSDEPSAEETIAIREALKAGATVITITPNYNAIFERFRESAGAQLDHFSMRNKNIFTRKEVYEFVIAVRLAIGAMTTAEEVQQLRETIDAGGTKMFEVVQREQEG